MLALAYLMAFTYKLDTAPIPRERLGTHRAPGHYSDRLWKAIPIRYLLVMVDLRHADFQHCRTMLQRYVVLSVPHLLPEQTHYDVFKRFF